MTEKTENKNRRNNARLFKLNLPDGFSFPRKSVEKRILREYGALFAARGGAIPPRTVIFKNEVEVAAFQDALPAAAEDFGEFTIELQTPAMENLRTAIAEARDNNLKITPRGPDSGRRSYAETVELWASRVNPGLIHWVNQKKLTERAASKIRRMPPFEQVPEIFKLEAEEIFFSKDLSKSIVYSVAPPGTSQHLSMLALDVSEHNDAAVRAMLAKNQWFQTVVSDLPHFTFLGAAENQLSGLGLKKVVNGGREFWLPDL